MVRYGIVGSRRRRDLIKVIEFIDTLKGSDVVISGGCRGVDRAAEARAKQRNISTIVHLPVKLNIKHRYDMISRYYDRNRQIAEDCDILVAFPAPDRKGGTENTIKWAKKLGKEIWIR